jgi:hypothetical protein
MLCEMPFDSDLSGLGIFLQMRISLPDTVYQTLKDAGSAFCSYQLAGILSPKIVTTDFVYCSGRGLSGPARKVFRVLPW